jgi:hypothetical protein
LDTQIEEVEIMMTTLNGLSNSLESFIQGIFSRRKLTKFSRLLEDCTREEVQIRGKKGKYREQ